MPKRPVSDRMQREVEAGVLLLPGGDTQSYFDDDIYAYAGNGYATQWQVFVMQLMRRIGELESRIAELEQIE